MPPTTAASKAFVDLAAWHDVAWAPPAPPVKMEVPAPKAPALVVAATTPAPEAGASKPEVGSRWTRVHGFESEQLCQLLLEQGDELPSEHVAAVCSRIEQITGHKAPMKLAQRRVYISDWVAKNAPPDAVPTPRTGHASAAAPVPFSHTAATPTPATSAAVSARVACLPASNSTSPRMASMQADAAGEAKMALVQRIGALRDGNGRIHVPAEQLPLITSEVAATGRVKSPPSVSARRRLIEDWYFEASKVSPSADGNASVRGDDEGTADGQGATAAALAPRLSAASALITRSSSIASLPDAGDGGSLFPPSPAQAWAAAPPPPPTIPTAGQALAARADATSAGMRGDEACMAMEQLYPVPCTLYPVPCTATEQLFGQLTRREAEQPQSAELAELRRLSRRCLLEEGELLHSSQRITKSTGALPAGASPAELSDFVSDWHRWQVRRTPSYVLTYLRTYLLTYLLTAGRSVRLRHTACRSGAHPYTTQLY